MTAAGGGDRARASMLVKVPPDVAFRIFTEEIDQWWRRGLAYRVAGKRRGFIGLEGRLGGRLFESFEGSGSKAGETIVVETGRVTSWQPPTRLAFEWRNVNFSPDEKTCVEITFEPAPRGTMVTVTHSGWSQIRPDHPARHRKPVAAFLRDQGMWWGRQLSSLALICQQPPA